VVIGVLKITYTGTARAAPLDVTFKEDACRVRQGYGPENLVTLRKLALQLLSQQTDRLSMQKRRVKAAYDIDYLKKIII
jgi:hypothetical protein